MNWSSAGVTTSLKAEVLADCRYELVRSVWSQYHNLFSGHPKVEMFGHSITFGKIQAYSSTLVQIPHANHQARWWRGHDSGLFCSHMLSLPAGFRRNVKVCARQPLKKEKFWPLLPFRGYNSGDLGEYSGVFFIFSGYYIVIYHSSGCLE